ncbi:MULTISPECIES: hypothetical protein [Rhizobium]|uniref:Periplasmic protein-like protein n=1 Tax=Rhizobium paranaense TaxID=1650438 RepID=A0A7W9D1B2_9HYPH|nr:MULTISPECIES: hypothetical protein [Rhizobium]MBB5574144.1 hypothetical protein [Rhizobium paranaense]PST62262.1 hypothetical protein C9E91_17060 [Rhizobium sp. SEMIA4064]
MRHLLFAALFLFSSLAVGHAAQITSEPGVSGIDLITVKGVINVGDDAVFRRLATASDKALVVLNSEGGALSAGIEIGRAIRLRGFATVVAQQTLCASACALIWLAGSPRFLDRASKIGFHAAFRLADGKASESGVGNALVGAYLDQIGLPEAAIIYVTTAPPEGIEWLTPEKATRVGIAYQPIEPETAARAPRSESESVFDPMTTVSAFYSALSAADGERASALVVPEKRGKGPFNERSIQDYFGDMSMPLTLRSVTRSNDEVRVAYDYVTNAGRTCHGRAVVQTVFVYGKTLISRIKALDGC